MPPDSTRSKSKRKQKIEDIVDAINCDETALFRQLAISTNGLVKDRLRRQIWPKLLDLGYFQCSASENEDTDDDKSSFCTCCSTAGSDDERRPLASCSASTSTATVSCLDSISAGDVVWLEKWHERIEQLKSHSDYDQVALDVKRTLKRFPPNVTSDRRQQLQDQLTPIIVAVLSSNSNYRYYQGFHDVCLTVLLVFDDVRKTLDFCKCLARTYFRSFLTLNLEVACCKPLRLIYPLIYATNRRLFIFLEYSQVGVHFAVSWTLTWFAHVVDDYKPLVRLYDFFLASHPMAPIYLSAALVLHKGDDLMLKCADDPDMALVHHFLSESSRGHLPVELLIKEATELFERCPPTKLINLVAEADSFAQKSLAALRQQQQKMVKRSRSLNDLKDFVAQAPGAFSVRRAVVVGVATAAAAYYVYAHYGLMLSRFYL